MGCNAQVPEWPGGRLPSLDAVLITPVSACTSAAGVVVVCRGGPQLLVVTVVVRLLLSLALCDDG